MEAANPLLRLIALKRPPIFRLITSSYTLFLHTTPFLFLSIFFSMLYVHLYNSESELPAGRLPQYPDPGTRSSLSLVLGEVHRQLVPAVALDSGARSLYRYRVLWLHRIGQDLRTHPARNATVVFL